MTWATREAPILEAILAIEEADRDRVTTGELATTTGLSEPDAQRGLLTLQDRRVARQQPTLGSP